MFSSNWRTMKMADHPMQPAPEQFSEWLAEACKQISNGRPGDIAGLEVPVVVAALCIVARLAYAAGADAELDACVEWISRQDWTWTSSQLLVARRPKPKSLKQQALQLLQPGEPRLLNSEMQDIICRALETLPDDN
jgi:hypothetical protein